MTGLRIPLVRPPCARCGLSVVSHASVDLDRKTATFTFACHGETERVGVTLRELELGSPALAVAFAGRRS